MYDQVDIYLDDLSLCPCKETVEAESLNVDKELFDYDKFSSLMLYCTVWVYDRTDNSLDNLYVVAWRRWRPQRHSGAGGLWQRHHVTDGALFLVVHLGCEVRDTSIVPTFHRYHMMAPVWSEK